MQKGTAILLGAAAGAGALAARKAWVLSHEETLAGEVAVVTGASRGLGLALARELAREGCKLAICARDEEELRRAAVDLRRRGAAVLPVICDVTRKDEVERMIATVRKQYGRIDLLVNNAGVIEVGPVDSMETADFERAMNVIFWGTVHATLAVLPDFLERKAGRIVNIVSVGGRLAVPHLLPYSSAKFAVSGFTEGLAAEVSPRGVQVCGIYPGLMRTGSHVQAEFKGDQRKEAEWFTLGATVPGVSMSARRAARQVVRTVKRREPLKVLSLPAQTAAKAHDLFPRLAVRIAGLAAETLLPKPRKGGKAQRGAELADRLHPAVRALSVLGRHAMRAYNQRA